MVIPEQLKIGAHLFKVIRRPMDGKMAETDRIKQTITIDSEIQGTVAISTLLHEAKHVMNSEIDHALLDSLAEQEAQFLIDNRLLRD